MAKNDAPYAVVGFATNLLPERVEVFAKTLRDVYSKDECDLVLITNAVSEAANELGKKYAIQFIHTPSVYSFSLGKFSKLIIRAITYTAKGLDALTSRSEAFRVVFHELYEDVLRLWHHPFFVRWLSYQDFLSTHRSYEKILVSDVRDVAFQTRFFEELGEADLHFFKQDVSYGGEDYWDSNWYRQGYGAKAFSQVDGKPVLCAGTVMGTLAGMDAFLDVVCAEILRRPYGVVDQAIYNKLFYENAFQHIAFKVHENAEGPVLTLNKDSWDRFAVKPEGLFNTSGKLIPVVHMYDRHEEAMQHFSGRMGHELAPSGLAR